MTKGLSPEEKKKRKKERKEARKRTKAAEKAKRAAAEQAKTETPPGPPEGPPATKPPVNICDECAYEYGACEGVPKFAEDDPERVVECTSFFNVDSMPTVDEKNAGSEVKSGEGASGEDVTREVKPFDLAMERLDEFGQAQLKARAEEICGLAEAEEKLRFGLGTETTVEQRAEILVNIVAETIKREGGPTDGLVHAAIKPGATEEEKAADAAVMSADLEARQKNLKRFQREEDLGTCPSCERPLKRTALNRYRDAVRCTNIRCRQYRNIVKMIPAE